MKPLASIVSGLDSPWLFAELSPNDIRSVLKRVATFFEARSRSEHVWQGVHSFGNALGAFAL